MSTAELVDHLAAAGLSVSASRIADDIRAGFLPTVVVPPGMRSRAWPLWSVRRAFYLYRLRTLNISGDLLRLVLFLRDGWGWEGVRPVVLTGFKKAIEVQRTGLEKRLRQVTRRGIETMAEDIAQDRSINEPLYRWFMGIGLFGAPLEGGSPASVVEELQRQGVPMDDDLLSSTLDTFVAGVGTWAEMERVLEQAPSEIVERARELHRRLSQKLRVMIRKASPDGTARTSPMSLGMDRTELVARLRHVPGRVTPAQCFASTFAVMIIASDLDARTNSRNDG